ncbi:MAG: sugar ABC transporter permease [Planctomycetota bacterium]|nr:sugar ABC transporter permease [Planctomycetota bacterium]
MNNTPRESLTFVVPAFAVYTFVVLAPVAATVAFSFFSGGISSEMAPAGLSNYITLLSDSVFYRAFGHNLALAGASVLFQLPIALGFALAFQTDNSLSRGLRSLVFAPMILPSTVIAVLFMLIYDPVSGPLSVLCRDIFGTSPAWLGAEAWVLPSLIAGNLLAIHRISHDTPGFPPYRS